MNKKYVIYGLLALWLAAYGWSFAVTQILEPTGDGFTRGLNRLEAFFKWQFVAAILAIAAWVLGRAYQKGSVTRWVSRAPAILAGLLLALVVGVIVVANFGKPRPVPPQNPGPTTQPAEPISP